MHGMEAGLAALFAGDRDLPLVTAHVVDELGEKDGGGERGREGERERVKPTSRGKNAAEMQGCQKKVGQ